MTFYIFKICLFQPSPGKFIGYIQTLSFSQIFLFCTSGFIAMLIYGKGFCTHIYIVRILMYILCYQYRMLKKKKIKKKSFVRRSSLARSLGNFCMQVTARTFNIFFDLDGLRLMVTRMEIAEARPFEDGKVRDVPSLSTGIYRCANM